jgi:two-component system, chemotaxis family, chemotaxis protein CheY
MPKTVLIVDDSAVVRRVIRGHLEGLGFACDEAADGAQAVRWCTDRMPDIILLDWNMPVMNGLDFLRALRVMRGGDAPVVIFCTTENTMERITQALDAGAQDFIMKPFDRDILRSKLEQNGLLPESEGGA